MAEGSDPESKTEEATPRKLEEARKKGDVAKSPDVAAAMSLAGATAVLLIGGGYFSRQMAEDMLPFLAEPHAMIGGLEAGAGVEIGMRAVWAVTPLTASTSTTAASQVEAPVAMLRVYCSCPGVSATMKLRRAVDM